MQHGVISRAQCFAAGLSPAGIKRRLGSGRWRAILPRVYVLTIMRRTWHQRVMAAVLWGGSTALASHRSAAALWELDGAKEGLIEISIAAGRRVQGITVHRRLPHDNPGKLLIERIPTTGIERTLIDYAAVARSSEAGRAIDDALRRQRTTLRAMRAHLTKGRPGARALRRLLDARDSRDEGLESRLETALLALLRARRVPLPEPQHEVRDGDSLVARLDFAYPAWHLGIETDGFRWHSGLERWQRDLRRENRLKLLGWTLLRFSWVDVHERPADVVRQIRVALRLQRERSLNQVRFPDPSERPSARTWRR